MNNQWNNPWAYVWVLVCAAFIGIVPQMMRRADSAGHSVLWLIGGLAVFVSASVMRWRWRPAFRRSQTQG